jgi:hypothetical protein
MSQSSRKRSPNAPALPLDDALERAIKVYEREQQHPAPTDVVAQNIGYKSANSGAALTTIAALRSYGLLNKMGPGKLAVDGDVQSYHYTPDQDLKQELLIKWLRSPAIFSYLLDKYEGSLPSDPTIRLDLIQEGFKPGKAEAVLKAFKKSVEFASYYQSQQIEHTEDDLSEVNNLDERGEQQRDDTHEPKVSVGHNEVNMDRIPVRLDVKRRAWLEIPAPFYEADKERIKAQIDLLLTDGKEDE